MRFRSCHSSTRHSRGQLPVSRIGPKLTEQGVIDSSTQPSNFATSPFLARAASTIARRSGNVGSLDDEESLLEEWSRLLPRYWHYDTETTNSRDPVRITQAERLHCVCLPLHNLCMTLLTSSWNIWSR